MTPFSPFFIPLHGCVNPAEGDESLVTMEEEEKKESDMWGSLVQDAMPETPPSVMEEARGIEIDVFQRMKKAQSRGIRVEMKDGILRAIGPGRERG